MFQARTYNHMKRMREGESSQTTIEGKETSRVFVSFTPEQELAVKHVEPVQLWADTLEAMFKNPGLSSITEYSGLTASLPGLCIVQIESIKILFSRVHELRPLLKTVCMRDMEPWNFGGSERYTRAFNSALNLIAWLDPKEKTERILWGALVDEVNRAGDGGKESKDAKTLLVNFAQKITIHEEKFDEKLLIKVFNGLENPDQLYAIGEKNRRLHDALVARIIEKGKDNSDWKCYYI